MNTISLVLSIFAIIWFFGGIFFFSWVWWGTLVKNIKLSVKKTKELAKILAMASALLAPFLIPIIVTAICLIAG